MLLALAAVSGVRLQFRLSGEDRLGLRFMLVYLVLINWFYLVDAGI
jgi:hypothetical protein